MVEWTRPCGTRCELESLAETSSSEQAYSVEAEVGFYDSLNFQVPYAQGLTKLRLEVGLCSSQPAERSGMITISLQDGAVFTGHSLASDSVEHETKSILRDVVAGQKIRLERTGEDLQIVLTSGLDGSEILRKKWPHPLKLVGRLYVFVRVFAGNPLRYVSTEPTRIPGRDLHLERVQRESERLCAFLERPLQAEKKCQASIRHCGEGAALEPAQAGDLPMHSAQQVCAS